MFKNMGEILRDGLFIQSTMTKLAPLSHATASFLAHKFDRCHYRSSRNNVSSKLLEYWLKSQDEKSQAKIIMQDNLYDIAISSAKLLDGALYC
jgi:hypothetical protein